MSDSSVVVMTACTAKPGREREVDRALRDVAKAARAQPGCDDYRILRSTQDPAITINFERWTSDQARNAFLAGPEVGTFSTAVAGAFVDSPQPVSYQVIE